MQEKKINDFVNELSTIRFHIDNRSVNSPVGYAVLIHVQNKEIIAYILVAIYGYYNISEYDNKYSCSWLISAVNVIIIYVIIKIVEKIVKKKKEIRNN